MSNTTGDDAKWISKANKEKERKEDMALASKTGRLSTKMNKGSVDAGTKLLELNASATKRRQTNINTKKEVTTTYMNLLSDGFAKAEKAKDALFEAIDEAEAKDGEEEAATKQAILDSPRHR